MPSSKASTSKKSSKDRENNELAGIGEQFNRSQDQIEKDRKMLEALLKSNGSKTEQKDRCAPRKRT